MTLRVEGAEEFVQALFGAELPRGLCVAVWSKATKRSCYLANPAEAGAFDGHVDTYIGVGLVRAGLSARRRPKAEDVAGIGGLWLDADVNGGPEDKTGAAPTVDEAVALLHSELEPTVIVNSGYGLQGWWLFDKPWVFADAADRQDAAQLVRGWHARHLSNARARGYSIDATFDLTRLMRLPGTLNGKGGVSVPVTLRHP